MITPVHPSALAAADPPLALQEFARNPDFTEEQKIAEASRQFEAVLLRQILAQARKPMFESEFSSHSFSAGVYEDLITTQLADQISRADHLGLADRITAELTHHRSRASVAPHDPSLH